MILSLILLASAAPEANAHDAWTSCLNTKGHLLAQSKETTEVAALATLGSCKEEENAYFRRAFKTPTLERMIAGPRQLDPQFLQAQEARRSHEIEEVIQTLIAGIASVRAGIE